MMGLMQDGIDRENLAQEFDVQGSSQSRTFAWDETGAPQPSASGNAPQGGPRDGGRSDPGRDRGNHYGNVRGSP